MCCVTNLFFIILHFIYRDYYVVEFPEEADTPLAVVPYCWLDINENNKTICMWPNGFKSNKQLTNAVISKQEIPISETVPCRITVKFKTSKLD